MCRGSSITPRKQVTQDAIVRYGPAAGRDAARAGAHREAVAHFGLVLEHEDRFAPGERAAATGPVDDRVLHDRSDRQGGQTEGGARSREPLAGGSAPARRLPAVAVADRLVDGGRSHSRGAGRPGGDPACGRARCRAARAGPEQRIAAVHGAGRFAESIAYGERAAALARGGRCGGHGARPDQHRGVSRWGLGDPAGQPTLDEALRVALEAGDVEDACRAYVNLVRNLLDWCRLEEAERYLTAAMKLAEEESRNPVLYAGHGTGAAGVGAGLVGRGGSRRRELVAFFRRDARR